MSLAHSCATDFLQTVKAAAEPDIRALAEEAGFVPAGGRRYRCGVHPDKHPSAYSYDNGLYCFGCQRRWDAIDLACIIIRDSTAAAVRYLADRYGISNRKSHTRFVRFTEEVYTDAGLFRVGFRWQVERHLESLKELLWLDENAPECASIRGWTRLLTKVESLSDYRLAHFYVRYRRVAPVFVDECIAEATQCHVLFATVLSSANSLWRPA
jgi:hypothetical protein